MEVVNEGKDDAVVDSESSEEDTDDEVFLDLKDNDAMVAALAMQLQQTTQQLQDLQAAGKGKDKDKDEKKDRGQGRWLDCIDGRLSC